MNIGCPTSLSIFFCPTVQNSSTWTLSSATTPVIMLHKLGSPAENGLHYSSLSLCILASVTSLCFALVVNTWRLKSCRAMLYSEYTGGDTVHRLRCSSVIPLLLVRPPVDLSHLISVCSITRSAPSPAQNWSVLRITWNPSWHFLNTVGFLVSRSFNLRRYR